VGVPMTSINAYYELKEEGKISERQELAFMTIRKFHEDKGYWPTPKEVHAFLAVEQGNEMAQFEGPNMVKPRITELLEDPDDDYPDLLEKNQESRKQEYIEELLDDYDSKKATPVKIAENVIDRTEAGKAAGKEEVDDVDEKDEKDENPVMVPSDDEEEVGDLEDDVVDEDSEQEDKKDDSPEPGDLLYGSEDNEDDEREKEDTEQASEEDDHTVTSMEDRDGTRYERVEDGVGNWKDGEGNRYILHPKKGFEEVSEEDDSEGLDGSEDDNEEKEQKQPSLNEI